MELIMLAIVSTIWVLASVYSLKYEARFYGDLFVE